jgi:peptidoglycan lytic transglycosylase G
LALEVQPTPPFIVQKKSPWRWVKWAATAVFIVFVSVAVCVFFWYKQSLEPRDLKSKMKIHMTVEQGQNSSDITRQLEQKGIIKSAVALEWYMKLEHSGHNLQAGRYALSPTLTAPQIIAHLEKGKTDLFMITILSGKTLSEIKKILQKYGYSSQEIDKALMTEYNHPLLADRPAGQDLEGYIFPESYEMQSTATLESLFKRDFDNLYDKLKADGLIEQFKARGLNLHQALTLASIVQKETSSPDEQRKVAQVFYNRISKGMKLESDTTFIYAAKKLGVEPTVSIDSPYNTRLHEGLPPGPIGNMEFSALQAVAQPTPHDFLYFVAGDDGVIYYAHTLEEHEGYVQRYCHKLCN